MVAAGRTSGLDAPSVTHVPCLECLWVWAQRLVLVSRLTPTRAACRGARKRGRTRGCRGGLGHNDSVATTSSFTTHAREFDDNPTRAAATYSNEPLQAPTDSGRVRRFFFSVTQ